LTLPYSPGYIICHLRRIKTNTEAGVAWKGAKGGPQRGGSKTETEMQNVTFPAAVDWGVNCQTCWLRTDWLTDGRTASFVNLFAFPRAVLAIIRGASQQAAHREKKREGHPHFHTHSHPKKKTHFDINKPENKGNTQLTDLVWKMNSKQKTEYAS